MSKTVTKIIGCAIGFIVVFALVNLIVAAIFMFAYNLIAPTFSWPQIDYIVANAIVFIFSLIGMSFGGSTKGSSND